MYDKIENSILSLKQKENRTYFYLNPYKIAQLFGLSFTQKTIIRNKTQNINKLILLDNNKEFEVTRRKYYYVCPSCKKTIEKNLHQFYELLLSNSHICKNCKNTVSHRLEKYQEKYSSSMIEKYGKKTPLNNKEIKEKFKQTMIAKYN